MSSNSIVQRLGERKTRWSRFLIHLVCLVVVHRHVVWHLRGIWREIADI